MLSRAADSIKQIAERKMARRKTLVVNDPYWYHEHVHVYYELEFNNDIIKPGDQIRIKNTRGTFTFVKWVHNSQKDVTWIDCRDNKTHEDRSFYIENLKMVIRPKKSRRKKIV